MTALDERFDNPPKEFSPVPLWWWSGERLDPERLRWQMERFVEGGVHNLVVMNLAPTGPLYGSDPDDPPFFSDEWWEIFRGVCRDARELGVRIWFYDQIGFSGANVQGEVVKRHPEFAGHSLDRVTHDLSGPGAVECPAGGTPLAACALPVDPEGAPRGEPIALEVRDGRAVWEGSGPHRLMLFYRVSRGFDYFSPEACRALIGAIHGQFEARAGEYIGDVIVGSFQDELPAMPTWSATFAEEFRRRRGYDLLPRLAALWEDYGEETGIVRRDYHATRADLAEEAFFETLHEWHERRGLLCGFDQHHPARAGHPVAATALYADYLRTHRWYSAPGSDHHGDAKVHSSLAHLHDRPRVWIEAFHSSGWGGTLEETFDWLLPWLRAGANLYDPHATYYSTRGAWYEWAPPSTDWRQPYWRHYGQFSKAVARLCSALTLGDHVCDVGVLFPTTTVQAGLALDGPSEEARAAHETYLELVGQMHWVRTVPGALDGACRDYDVLDDGSVQRGTVSDGRLRIGREEYRAVVLPSCAAIEDTTAAKLAELADSGGAVIAVGALPRTSLGTDSDGVARLLRLFEQGRAVHVPDTPGLRDALAPIEPTVEASVPTLMRRVDGTTILFVPAVFPRATRMPGEAGGEINWLDVDYDFDPSRYERSVRVRVRGVSGAPVLYEPVSGRRRTLPVSEDGSVEVPFEDGPCALLVWGSEATSAEPLGTYHEVSRTSLEGDWTTELVPTLDNRWGDFALPPSSAPQPVEVWDLRGRGEPDGASGVELGWHTSEHDDSDWLVLHASFGPRGVSTGPSDPDALPEPIRSVADWRSDGWRVSEYSLSRGIYKDRLHQQTLGPKAHVPEEFLDFGRVGAGQAVQYRTILHVPAALETHLAVGAPGIKRAWINGNEVGEDHGYLMIAPVRLGAGDNVLELRVTAEEDGDLRAHFALVTDPEAYRRPEWIRAAGGPAKDSSVLYRKTFEVRGEPVRAVAQVGAVGPCRVIVNGEEVGRHGGFDPYLTATSTRVQPYDVTGQVRRGENTLEVEVNDRGAHGDALVDCLVETRDGRTAVVTDPSWEASRDGRRVETLPRRRQVTDPGWAHLWRRPHPLPDAGWLDGRTSSESPVQPLVPRPGPALPRVEWLRFVLPPGATEMELPAHGDVTVYVDGKEVGRVSGAARVVLPNAERTGRLCALRVQPEPGYAGGGVLEGPPRFETARGRMPPGNWRDLGLHDYSGGVRYSRLVEWTPHPSTRSLLDLGRVRGTAEVRVNGEDAGARFLSPYVFDLTDHLREGENELEVTVYNTLGPYFDAASPTHYVFPIQRDSGLFGPIVLREVSVIG